MIELVRTTDPVKLAAILDLLRQDGLDPLVFDTAAASTWLGVIPARLMIAEGEEARARVVLAAAGFRRAADGDWDL